MVLSNRCYGPCVPKLSSYCFLNQVLRDGVNQAASDRRVQAAGRDDPRGPEDRGLQAGMPLDLRLGDQGSFAE